MALLGFKLTVLRDAGEATSQNTLKTETIKPREITESLLWRAGIWTDPECQRAIKQTDLQIEMQFVELHSPILANSGTCQVLLIAWDTYFEL